MEGARRVGYSGSLLILSASLLAFGVSATAVALVVDLLALSSK